MYVDMAKLQHIFIPLCQKDLKSPSPEDPAAGSAAMHLSQPHSLLGLVLISSLKAVMESRVYTAAVLLPDDRNWLGQMRHIFTFNIFIFYGNRFSSYDELALRT